MECKLPQSGTLKYINNGNRNYIQVNTLKFLLAKACPMDKDHNMVHLHYTLLHYYEKASFLLSIRIKPKKKKLSG